MRRENPATWPDGLRDLEHQLLVLEVMLIAREISIACRVGVEVAAAVGGRIGNFFCGDSWVTSDSLDGCTAYQLGIMEILMNSMLLLSVLGKFGVQTRLLSLTGINLMNATQSQEQLGP